MLKLTTLFCLIFILIASNAVNLLAANSTQDNTDNKKTLVQPVEGDCCCDAQNSK